MSRNSPSRWSKPCSRSAVARAARDATRDRLAGSRAGLPGDERRRCASGVRCSPSSTAAQRRRGSRRRGRRARASSVEPVARRGSRRGPRRRAACMRRKRSVDSSCVSAEFGSSNRNTRASLRERPRDLGALLDRERQLAERLVARRRGWRGRRSSARSRSSRSADASARALAPDHDVLARRSGWGRAAAPGARRRRGRSPSDGDHGLAVELDLALVAGRLAGEDLDHRALAGAVRAGDAEDLARPRRRGRGRRARRVSP